jgi:membrane protein insertase Oxa1/YidC/SpoIIIJ
VAIAVAVVASTVTAAVLQLHIAGVTDERRRFFAAYMLPVILGGVTLFAAPVAILLGWLTTVLVNIAVLLVVRREVSRVAA